MKSLKEILDGLKRGPTDVVGIDVTPTAVNAVRMRGIGSAASVLAVDVLPLPELSEPLSAEEGAPLPPPLPMTLPSKLKGKYACISLTGEAAIVKLLTFPGAFDAEAEGKITGSLGIQDPEKYRVGYKLVAEGHGKGESRVLAVAIPEPEAANAIQLFPAGVPAPFSLEVSGLATLTAFARTLTGEKAEHAVAAVDFGDRTTTFAVFNKGGLSLLRRFDLGTFTVLDKVQETLGVDLETAHGIISDGSFDISQSVSEVMEPLMKQLVVSRDFVERRENCRVSHLCVSGGLVVSRDSIEEMKSSMGVEVEPWNPFAGLDMASDALPESFAGKEWRFAAALGACLATLEEQP